jgi:hypothetical protein
MQWVTRTNVRLDRAACAWLIVRHIDPRAEIAYVEAGEIDAAVAAGALPFHNTTSEDSDLGERTSFDLLLAEYKLDQNNPALLLLSDIVHGAETKGPDAIAESEGLRAIAKGANALAANDEEMVARMLPIFDALYAYCRRRVVGQRGWANNDVSIQSPEALPTAYGKQ